MVEPAHEQVGEREAAQDAEQEDHRPVARLRQAVRRQQPAAARHPGTEPGLDQLLRHRVDQLDELRGQKAQGHATQCQPDHAGALPQTRVVRVGEFVLARLAEEDHAEELDHGVAGQR